MNYELAKQLKDAGFPQKNTGVFSFSYVFETKEGNLETGDKAYVPTLSELIEACGERFDSLENAFQNGWRADGWDITEEIILTKIGSTPEEAVAKLWLKLHERT